MAESWLNGYYMRDDYFRNIARGFVDGAEIMVGYGRRVSAAAESGILWPNGAYALPPATGIQPTIASTSANDTAAGTGIRTLEVHYLDTTLTPQFEVITMAGLTPVLMAATNVRMIQCMHMLTWGSLAHADGNISAAVGAQNYSYIAAGEVRCASSVRMVPAGKRLLVFGAFAGSSSGTAAGAVEVSLSGTYFEGHDFSSVSQFMPYAAGGFQDSSTAMDFPCPFPFHEGDAFGLEYTVDKASVVIVGSWFGVLENI